MGQARIATSAIARSLERSALALAWVSAQPGVSSVILGASKLEQLRDNLASLDLNLTADQRQTLDKASALDPSFPSMIFTPEVNRGIFGGKTVEGWR